MSCTGTTTQILEFVENDTPDLTCTLKDTDITSYSFSLHIGYTVPVVVAGTIVVAATGDFKFTFTAGQLQVGTFDAEIQITNASGNIVTVQGLRFNIHPEIA